MAALPPPLPTDEFLAQLSRIRDEPLTNLKSGRYRENRR
jgi:hypothetical protein